jgi:hypothetical protein
MKWSEPASTAISVGRAPTRTSLDDFARDEALNIATALAQILGAVGDRIALESTLDLLLREPDQQRQRSHWRRHRDHVLGG